ncbi:MAG TPA: hypothetical protein VN841_11870 [Bryobacteraceae bacterium]|nr:hypothetical protein [Bryobacteraceae bacterium]
MVRNSIQLYPLGYPVAVDPGPASRWTTEALEAARESWGGGEARFDGRLVRVQIRARPGPPPAKAPPRFRARRGWIQLICDASNHGAFIPARRMGRVCVSTELLLDRDWFRWHLLEPLVLAALDHVFFTPLHAACVSRNGRSVLLCGDSGAGKSCLTYACVRRGWTLVSDDAVHLAPFPENTVAGGSSVIRLREPARALFPELREDPAGTARNGKIAIEVTPRAGGFAVTRFATPSHIVFLARRPGAARLHSYPAGKALAYFMKYLWHCDTSKHERRLQHLLAGGAQVLEVDGLESGVDALESLVAKS